MTSSGSEVSANGCEPAQVAEDDDDLASVALQERLVTGVDHQVDQLRWEETAQPVDPLQLLDLSLHARLELAVPTLQLGRLGLDGVVVALDP